MIQVDCRDAFKNKNKKFKNLIIIKDHTLDFMFQCDFFVFWFINVHFDDFPAVRILYFFFENFSQFLAWWAPCGCEIQNHWLFWEQNLLFELLPTDYVLYFTFFFHYLFIYIYIYIIRIIRIIYIYIYIFISWGEIRLDRAEVG